MGRTTAREKGDAVGVGNRLAMLVLRSPLHFLVSRSLLMLCYEGRRSSRLRCLPLQYVRDGDTLVIWAGDAPAKTWWRNFRDPWVVTVRLRRKKRYGKAFVVEDVEEKVAYLDAYFERFPYTTPSGKPKFLGRNRRPDADALRKIARDAVLVAVELDG